MEEYRECCTLFAEGCGGCIRKGMQNRCVLSASHKAMSDSTIEYGEKDEDYLNVFSEVCVKLEIEFLDMADTFQKLYSEEFILAHGFSNNMFC